MRQVEIGESILGTAPPGPSVKRAPERPGPVLALALDPLVAAVGLVRDAATGAMLCADGRSTAIPGLPNDVRLRPGTALRTAARRRIGDGAVSSSFLWPDERPPPPGGHVRVTVLGAPPDGPAGLIGMVVLSPAAGLHGLSPRELEVLGLLVEGCSNQQIAHRLLVTPRTVATHLEHVLVKLGVPCRTMAAVRAEREGLYVPAEAVSGGGPATEPGHGTADGLAHGGT